MIPVTVSVLCKIWEFLQNPGRLQNAGWQVAFESGLSVDEAREIHCDPEPQTASAASRSGFVAALAQACGMFA